MYNDRGLGRLRYIGIGVVALALIGGCSKDKKDDAASTALYDTGFELLRVLSGDTIYTVAIPDSSVTDKKGAEIALANALIENLG